MRYIKQMSKVSPGLIIIMVDQSGSMRKPFISEPKIISRAEFSADIVNNIINELIIANADGMTVKNRCFIAVIGYGQTVKVWAADMLQNLADNPLRVEMERKLESNGRGEFIEIEYSKPIWMEPLGKGGTLMGRAFQEVAEVIEAWQEKIPDGPAPIIINITDGRPNNRKFTKKNIDIVKDLGTSDGKVLLFNAHISQTKLGQVKFPNNANILQEEYAQYLFNISSEIPLSMFPIAKRLGITLKTGSRGLVYNASAESLIQLLNFGSSSANN